MSENTQEIKKTRKTQPKQPLKQSVKFKIKERNYISGFNFIDGIYETSNELEIKILRHDYYKNIVTEIE